jgi:ribonuclease HI
MAKYHIFTDGSSRGNPGPGGWGMIVMNENESEIIFIESDTENPTTNNRMELKAMICAFGYVESHPRDQFIIYSDSAYVVNSVNSWIRGWAANGWRNSKKQTVENLDLMQALHYFLVKDFFNAEVRKCDGHAGNIGNELADALATGNQKKYQEVVDYWFDRPEDEAGDNWFPID